MVKLDFFNIKNYSWKDIAKRVKKESTNCSIFPKLKHSYARLKRLLKL